MTPSLLAEYAWSNAVKILFMEKQGCSRFLNSKKKKEKKGEEEMTIRNLFGCNGQVIGHFLQL